MAERVVDTGAYVSVLRELAESGKTVSMRIAGNSMSPFLVHDRDYIFFTRPEREIRRGDMVFYQRFTGQYVMHRVCRLKDNIYHMVADAQPEVEGPLYREQIFALITAVKRKGKIVRPGDFWWEFFEHIWVRLIPARRLIVKSYSIISRVFPKKRVKE